MEPKLVWSVSSRCGPVYLAIPRVWPRPCDAELATRRHPDKHRSIGDLLGAAVTGGPTYAEIGRARKLVVLAVEKQCDMQLMTLLFGSAASV